MKTLPLPALVAAVAALAALPFNLAAAATLFLTAWLGLIIHADYTLRRRRVALPRQTAPRTLATIHAIASEPNQLAA